MRSAGSTCCARRSPGCRRATLHVVEDGDHSFAVRVRSGRDQAAVRDEIVQASVAWLRAGGRGLITRLRMPPCLRTFSIPDDQAASAPAPVAADDRRRTPAPIGLNDSGGRATAAGDGQSAASQAGARVGSAADASRSRVRAPARGAATRGRTSPAPCSAPLLLAVVVLVLYANSFSIPFLFDDYFEIGRNPMVKTIEPPLDYLRRSRGIPAFTFALNYRWRRFRPVGLPSRQRPGPPGQRPARLCARAAHSAPVRDCASATAAPPRRWPPWSLSSSSPIRCRRWRRATSCSAPRASRRSSTSLTLLLFATRLDDSVALASRRALCSARR